MISVGKMSSGMTLRVRSGEGTWAPFNCTLRIALAEAAHVDELIVDERQAGDAAQRGRNRAVADARDRFGTQEVADDVLLDASADDVERRRIARPIVRIGCRRLPSAGSLHRPAAGPR